MDGDGAGGILMVGDGEAVGLVVVVGGGAIGGVALSGEVEEDDLALGCDGADGLGALLVGEVSPAVGDASLDEFGPVAGGLEMGAVVALDGEDIDPGEGGDELLGRAAEVGGVAEGGGGGLGCGCGEVDAEGDDAEGVVGEVDGCDVEVAGDVEGFVREDVGASFQEPGAGGAPAVSLEDAEPSVRGELLDPAGVAVVVVEVGEEDIVDAFESESEGGEVAPDAEWREPGVEEGDATAPPLAPEEERAVSGGGGGEDHKLDGLGLGGVRLFPQGERFGLGRCRSLGREEHCGKVSDERDDGPHCG